MICSTPDCGNPIGSRNRSGLCRSCHTRRLHTDPVFVARRDAGTAAAWSKPETREAHRAGCRAGAKKRMENPDYAARVIAQGRRIGISACHTPEARAKSAAKHHETRMAWCPPELRELNTVLKRAKMLLPERQAFIRAEVAERERRRIAADKAERELQRVADEAAEQARQRILAEAYKAAERARRKPKSFAEQLEAVRNGASLTERVVMPSRLATHVVGGSSLGDLS